MPPKKPPNVREQQKKLQKAIDDKTFGLKKTAKNKKYIQQLQNQVNAINPKQNQAKKAKEEADDLKDLSKLFKPVQDMPKVAADVDPKSVLCVFFKQGLCTKGKKCKFSHDLSVQQKTAKKNLYVDSRDLKNEFDALAETNENWDEDKLNEVAEKKHGEKDRKRPNQTEIICKYFLDAVENNKYGWFWECANGGKCIYKHCLPPGYVLAKDKKKMDEQKKLDQISLEELIEKERAKLSSDNQTKVTLKSFIAWKKKKLKERRQKETEEEIKKKTNAKSGKQAGLTGREMFLFNENMDSELVDDEGGAGFVREKDEDNPDEVKAFEIDDRTFMDIGENGQMIDDEDDDQPGPSNPVVFDESVFKAEDLDDLDDLPSEDDEEEDVEKEVESKLKI